MSVSGASLGALRTKHQVALAPEPPSLPWFQLLLEKVAAVTPPSPLELLAGLACTCRFSGLRNGSFGSGEGLWCFHVSVRLFEKVEKNRHAESEASRLDDLLEF